MSTHARPQTRLLLSTLPKQPVWHTPPVPHLMEFERPSQMAGPAGPEQPLSSLDGSEEHAWKRKPQKSPTPLGHLQSENPYNCMNEHWRLQVISGAGICKEIVSRRSSLHTGLCEEKAAKAPACPPSVQQGRWTDLSKGPPGRPASEAFAFPVVVLSHEETSVTKNPPGNEQEFCRPPSTRDNLGTGVNANKRTAHLHLEERSGLVKVHAAFIRQWLSAPFTCP